MTCTSCKKEIGIKTQLGLCRNCRVKKWHEKHSNRIKEIKAKWLKSNPIVRKQVNDEYRSNNREKVRVWAVLEYHVKKGHIVKSNKCQRCGKEKVLHAHHFDYSIPLWVKWVCPACHKIEHA